MSKIETKKFPGKGNGNVKILKFKDAIDLIMVLPGKVAKETRTKFTNIITRYMAGDETLVQEIQANAESTSPIAELARASLDEEKQHKLTHKRKLEQLELEERIVALEAQKVSTQAKLKEIQAMHVATMAKSTELYTKLCPNQEIDERGRVLLKDCVLNSITNGLLLTNEGSGAAPAPPATKFITISTLASELGYRFDTGILIKIGGEVKRNYESMYREEPPKHEQIVGGAVRHVCTYQERDRAMIESVLKRYAGASKKA